MMLAMWSPEDWVLGLNPVLQALIRVLLWVLPLLMLVPGLIWWERRLLGFMQDRLGPNRVGPFGLLQPIADGIKLFLKEDISPTAVDRVIYFVAPALALFPAFALGGTVPWGPFKGLTPVADVNVGILYVLAVSSLGVYGIVLAGYSSNNKYSLLGGLRSSAQLISYELAMGMAMAGTVVATGSLRFSDMVAAQQGPLWGALPFVQNWYIFTPFGFISAVVFLICMVAETNRAPFDLPEAENELIAGYHTEYSSMKFAVFFMGEYAAMLVFSAIFASLFLGGYSFVLPIRFAGASAVGAEPSGIIAFSLVWFFAKAAFVFTGFIWLRATLPRLRYDQLMVLGWKWLLPVAVANFLVAGLWLVTTELYGPSGGWIAVVAATILITVFAGTLLRSNRGVSRTFEERTVVWSDGKVARGATPADRQERSLGG